VEFHGDEGSLRLGSWFAPDSSVVFTPYEGQPNPIPVRDAPEHVDWSVGVAELVAAIEEGRPSQLDRDRSVHLVEILEAAETSANTGAPVDLNTGFEVPGTGETAKPDRL
jgi:predicted dehydrogenase